MDGISGGGGLLMVPAFMLAGLPPHMALGTNLFLAFVGTFSSIYRLICEKQILWKVAGIGVAFSVVGGAIGAQVALLIPSDLLGKIILVLIPLTLAFVLWPKRWVKEKHFSDKVLHIRGSVISFFVGLYNGFFTPGSSLFAIVMLQHFLRISYIQAIGITKILALVSLFSAVILFLIQGQISLFVALPTLLVYMVATYIGTHLAIKKGDQFVRGFLIFSITILFVSLVYKYF